MPKPTNLRCGVLWSLLVAIAAWPLAAQDSSGRWTGEENGQTVELVLRQEPDTSRITGTLSLLGASLPIEGRIDGRSMSIESMGGVSVALARAIPAASIEASFGSFLCVLRALCGESRFSSA